MAEIRARWLAFYADHVEPASENWLADRKQKKAGAQAVPVRQNSL